MKKDTTIQIRIRQDDKELLKKIAARSPQGDFSSWVTYLINQEINRVVEFDEEVRELVEERLKNEGIIR